MINPFWKCLLRSDRLLNVVFLCLGYMCAYEGIEREFHFDRLFPGRQYRIRVCCFSDGGRSEVSSWILLTKWRLRQHIVGYSWQILHMLCHSTIITYRFSFKHNYDVDSLQCFSNHHLPSRGTGFWDELVLVGKHEDWCSFSRNVMFASKLFGITLLLILS